MNFSPFSFPSPSVQVETRLFSPPLYQSCRRERNGSLFFSLLFLAITREKIASFFFSLPPTGADKKTQSACVTFSSPLPFNRGEDKGLILSLSRLDDNGPFPLSSLSCCRDKLEKGRSFFFLFPVEGMRKGPFPFLLLYIYILI